MTPEQTHAQAAVDAVRDEQALSARAQAIAAHLAEATDNFAKCAQVVLVLQDDMALLDAERRQLILMREQPKRYGVTQWKANMQYRTCTRELRRVRADLKYALLAERRAAKHKDKLERERVTVVREQKRNMRLQVSLGLIPKPKRRETLPPLVELARYTGLLDGSM